MDHCAGGHNRPLPATAPGRATALEAIHGQSPITVGCSRPREAVNSDRGRPWRTRLVVLLTRRRILAVTCTPPNPLSAREPVARRRALRGGRRLWCARIMRSLLSDAPAPVLAVSTSPKRSTQIGGHGDVAEIHLPARRSLGRLEGTRAVRVLGLLDLVSLAITLIGWRVSQGEALGLRPRFRQRACTPCHTAWTSLPCSGSPPGCGSRCS